MLLRRASFSVLALTLSITGACSSSDGGNGGADAGPPPAGDSGGPILRDAGIRLDAFVGADAGTPACTTGCGMVQVVAGFQHSCARRENGEVLCWGRNYDGEVGDGTMRHSDCNLTVGGEYLDCAAYPEPVSMLSDAESIFSHAGRNTCAKRRGGEIVCWGLEEIAAPGGTERLRRLTPTTSTAFAGASTLGIGERHSCIVNGGRVSCLGSNESGQIGDGTFTDRPALAAVSGITTATAVTIAAHADHTCALLADHTIRCWGDNTSRQLGDGNITHTTCGAGPESYDCSAMPVQVMGIDNAVEVAAGVGHTCARLSTGEVKCWGGNYWGQLGDGSLLDRPEPTLVPGITDAVQLVTTTNSTCIRRATGAVVCFGTNQRGQLGTGAEMGHETCDHGGSIQDCSSHPLPVMGLTDVRDVAAGLAHVCAATMGGDVWCWGFNENKQVGDATVMHAFGPKRVTTFPR